MINDYFWVFPEEDVKDIYKSDFRHFVEGKRLRRIISGSQTYDTLSDSVTKSTIDCVDVDKIPFLPKGEFKPAPKNDTMDAVSYAVSFLKQSENGLSFVASPKTSNIHSYSYYLTPKKIIQNGPAFIVLWKDGTKTVIKRKPNDNDDPYAAFGQALMKKIFGSTSAAHRTVIKVYEDQDGYIPEDVNPHSSSITPPMRKEMAALQEALDSISRNFMKKAFGGK